MGGGGGVGVRRAFDTKHRTWQLITKLYCSRFLSLGKTYFKSVVLLNSQWESYNYHQLLFHKYESREILVFLAFLLPL